MMHLYNLGKFSNFAGQLVLILVVMDDALVLVTESGEKVSIKGS